MGRERELAILREAWERVRSEQRCELVTVAGDAGVGKSRLAAEALASIDATVVRGRCLPYGEGITYWPVVEVLKQLDVLPADEAAAVAIRSLLGETEAATSAEEIAWAFRKTLEQAAAERPLVVVFDDIQWGEETFLDLVEHVALLSSGAAILLLCMARPELAERRPTWPVTLRLEPLGDERRRRAHPAADPRRAAREDRARRGRQPALHRGDAGDGRRGGGRGGRPAHAAGAARGAPGSARDGRAKRARAGCGRGRGLPSRRRAGAGTRRDPGDAAPGRARPQGADPLRPSRSSQGEDAFRFRHLLIRDAAYDALPKATRADLHQRFASWLEEHGTELVELDEILGYHLEQACRYRAELGMPDDGELAAAARRRLTAGGRRAQLSGRTTAPPSACSSAPPPSSRRPSSTWPWRSSSAKPCPGRAGPTTRCGAQKPSPREPQRRAIVSASSAGASRRPCSASTSSRRARRRRWRRSSSSALPVFQAAGDDMALYIAYSALAEVAFMRGQMGARHGGVRAGLRPRSAGGPPTAWVRCGSRRWSLLRHDSRVGTARVARRERATDWAGPLSSVPTGPGRWRCSVASTRRARSSPKHARSWRSAAGESCSRTSPRSSRSGSSSGPTIPPPHAEFGAAGFRLFEELGELGFLSTAAGYLAQALYALDRLDEADAWAGRTAELGASDDVA